MAQSFFFYDLETSGFSPSAARIMQFAGQRTDVNLKPIGEPVNLMIKLAGDILPDPDAVLITGITPQMTLQDGLTEAEFLDYFYKEVVKPDTIFVGFNSVRFDDEFMRYLNYRNFYDAYEWQWQNGCSRWDILDLVRMTRALRPEGIEWPFAPDGKPTNRLELLTKLNGLEHDHAHDALSDVMATIAVAQLIRDKQPDLFNYVLEHRGKKAVAELVKAGQPFVYTSGRYPSATWHTTVAVQLVPHPQGDAALVYDLRHDPEQFMGLSPAELADRWRWTRERPADQPALPVKTLKFNRCPAVAPLGVIKAPETQQRIDLSLDTITTNLQKLHGNKVFIKNVLAARELLDADRQQTLDVPVAPTTEIVDGLLYEGFLGDNDRRLLLSIRKAGPAEVVNEASKASDPRLRQLAPLYQARNYPGSLTADQRQAWEAHVAKMLFDGEQNSRLSRYFKRLQELSAGSLTGEQEYLLQELQLYGESIMPTDA